MKRTLLLTLSIAILIIGCREDENPYLEYEEERLTQLAIEKYEAIRTLAQARACTDPSEWKMVELNSVCGMLYVAYHQSTDEKKLQKLIKDYNLLMEVYMPYIAPRIDCTPYREPVGIVCEEGRPVVQYPEIQWGTD